MAIQISFVILMDMCIGYAYENFEIQQNQFFSKPNFY
jgi:hypothetical protein